MILHKNLFLNSLSLKNFATFEDQIINFKMGFNAIVGETGSGKSLILDALQLILGQRADKKLIRKSSEFTSIEASLFCSDEKIKSFLDTQGYPIEDNEIIIKRIIYSNGKSKSYINFQSCNLSLLNNFSKQYIDLVGQFENQKLLSESYQLLLLDRFCNNIKNKHKFQNALQSYNSVKEAYESLLSKNDELKQKQDYIQYQVDELSSLGPCIEEEMELVNKKNRITNYEKVLHLKSEISNLLHGCHDRDGILSLLSVLSKKIDSNQKLLNLNSMDKIEEFQGYIQDLDYEIESNLSLEIDENEIPSIIEKLDSYQKFKRKYHTDTTGLVELLSELNDELKQIESFDQKLDNLKQLLEINKEKAYQAAYELHKTRKKASKELSKLLTKEINELRMYGAIIDINVSENEKISNSGITSISFNAQTNPGEGLYKVKDIASGGELSRILLALRKVVSNQDSISIFLFDEVDTGIGGETALCIGKSLSHVSENSQVIAITHLPQIASFTNHLVIVDKEFDEYNLRTFSTIKEVSGPAIKSEVKKMIPISEG